MISSRPLIGQPPPPIFLGGGAKWLGYSVEGVLSTGPTPSSFLASLIFKETCPVSTTLSQIYHKKVFKKAVFCQCMTSRAWLYKLLMGLCENFSAVYKCSILVIGERKT